MLVSDLPVKKIPFERLPSYWRIGSRFPKGNTYIDCGEVKRGGNEPYCYPEEKQCAGRICRILQSKVTGECTVVRDDGTVWRIWLDAFKEIYLLDLEGGGAC